MQLQLFRTESEGSRKSPVWTQLSRDERAAAVAALVRLMVKTIRPDSRSSRDE
jgi:hypothetical protein